MLFNGRAIYWLDFGDEQRALSLSTLTPTLHRQTTRTPTRTYTPTPHAFAVAIYKVNSISRSINQRLPPSSGKPPTVKHSR
ncbi:unnamed protein product [Ceratitis capitata]|uniref:(Mediterranean fruit fly) hypothetical protein n=1 Tax=Ceratitis capitata TaxID=7213 RepID=A0A811UXD0_CERCA|nr:unnamed protein product [Ceratitis capitata]